MGTVTDLFGDPVASADLDGDPSQGRNDGSAAEFFACAVMAELGYFAHRSPSVGYDALLDVAGRVLRVQIKGRKQASRGDAYNFICQFETSNGRPIKGEPRLRRAIDRRDCDLLALVALDLRKAVFKAVPKTGILSVRVKRSEYLMADVERLSFEQALAEVDGPRS